MRLNRRYAVTGLAGFVFVSAMGYWWVQNHAFYEETWSDVVVIAGAEYPVTDWRGVDASSSPLNMRACFQIEPPVAAPPELDPVPLAGPAWLKCFGARFIGESVARGYGKAYVAAANEPKGFDRIVVVLPDGRAFMWRQPNKNVGL